MSEALSCCNAACKSSRITVLLVQITCFTSTKSACSTVQKHLLLLQTPFRTFCRCDKRLCLLRIAEGRRCLHTSAYVSIRQHKSAYVSIRQHTSACDERLCLLRIAEGRRFLHTSAYGQHTSACDERLCLLRIAEGRRRLRIHMRPHTTMYVSSY